MRGFGGRLMFYEGDGRSPSKSRGRWSFMPLTKPGRDPNNARPDRKYVFTPEQLPAHYSKSKIGHSYSVWLPWDEVGGMQKEITLVVRFEQDNGGVVVGEQCRQLLPGRSRPSKVWRSPPQPAFRRLCPTVRSMRLVGHLAWGRCKGPPTRRPFLQETQRQQDDDGQQRRMTTATIQLPPGMALAPAFAPAPAVPPARNWQRVGIGGAMPTPDVGMYTASPPMPTQARAWHPTPGQTLGRIHRRSIVRRLAARRRLRLLRRLGRIRRHHKQVLHLLDPGL